MKIAPGDHSKDGCQARGLELSSPQKRGHAVPETSDLERKRTAIVIDFFSSSFWPIICAWNLRTQPRSEPAGIAIHDTSHPPYTDETRRKSLGYLPNFRSPRK